MDKKRDSFFLTNKKKNKKRDKDGNGVKNEMKSDKADDKNKKKRQDNFLNNRVAPENGEEKKPFDKKAYRIKKYSKKYKLDQWEEQRKKQLLRNYYKEVKNDPAVGSYKPIRFDEDVVDSNQEVGRFVKHPDVLEKERAEKRKDPFKQAREQYNKIKQEKQQKKEAIEKAKEEKNQKLQEYKKKKHERFKKLSKKTKKGQPVMTGRMEILLDKIQSFK